MPMPAMDLHGWAWAVAANHENQQKHKPAPTVCTPTSRLIKEFGSDGGKHLGC